MVGRVGLAMIFPSLNAAAINPLSLALIPHGAGAINFLPDGDGVSDGVEVRLRGERISDETFVCG